MDIWHKCPRTDEVRAIEKKAEEYLIRHHLDRYFSLEKIEKSIYLCPPRRENEIFNYILSKFEGGSLKDLLEFNDIFREKLFPSVPQKILNGLSPVR